MALTDRFLGRLDRLTAPARERNAVSVFMLGTRRPWDELVSAAYFSLAARHWDEWADGTDHLAAFEHGLGWCREPRRVVDLGTGAGGSASLLARRFPGAEVIGVDASRRMIERARRRASSNMRLVRASGRRLPLEPEIADLVTTCNYLPDLREVRRITRPRGQVLHATTFRHLGHPDHAYLGRWADFGYVRLQFANIGRGSCELFELRE